MSAQGGTSPEGDEPESHQSSPAGESRETSSADKPVLEWTHEDWARWIDSGGGTLPTAAEVGTADPELTAPVDESAVEPTPAAPDPLPAEAAAAVPQAAPPAAGDQAFEPVVPLVVEDARSFEAVEPEVPVRDDPDPATAGRDEPAFTAAEVETPPAVPEPDFEAPEPEPATGVASPHEPEVAVPEAAPAFHPAAGGSVVFEEPGAPSDDVTGTVDRGASDDVAGTGDEALQPAAATAGTSGHEPAAAALDQPSSDPGLLERAPPPDAGTTDGEADDAWAAVSDHPWWKSAPVLGPQPVVSGEDPPTQVEEAVPPRAPEPVRQAPERPPVRTTRPMPAPAPRPAGGDVIRAQAPERSHRVRSALGLLGVAMSVGVIVAGLITVAIFAISLALRRAVG